jgi:DNA-binding MarR family transcriptional regulator
MSLTTSSLADLAATDSLSVPQHQADLLLFRLYRIHATAGPLVVRLCESRYGLTRREWRVLSFVAENEGVLSSELAVRALLDRARTSRNLTGLAAKGLIERRPRPANRREVQVYLTEQGRALHAELFVEIAAINSRLVEGFTPHERAALHSLLGHLQTRAEALVSPP